MKYYIVVAFLDMSLYCTQGPKRAQMSADSEVEAKATLLEKYVTTIAQWFSRSGTDPEGGGKK